MRRGRRAQASLAEKGENCGLLGWAWARGGWQRSSRDEGLQEKAHFLTGSEKQWIHTDTAQEEKGRQLASSLTLSVLCSLVLPVSLAIQRVSRLTLLSLLPRERRDFLFRPRTDAFLPTRSLMGTGSLRRQSAETKAHWASSSNHSLLGQPFQGTDSDGQAPGIAQGEAKLEPSLS